MKKMGQSPSTTTHASGNDHPALRLANSYDPSVYDLDNFHWSKVSAELSDLRRTQLVRQLVSSDHPFRAELERMLEKMVRKAVENGCRISEFRRRRDHKRGRKNAQKHSQPGSKEDDAGAASTSDSGWETVGFPSCSEGESSSAPPPPAKSSHPSPYVDQSTEEATRSGAPTRNGATDGARRRRPRRREIAPDFQHRVSALDTLFQQMRGVVEERHHRDSSRPGLDGSESEARDEAHRLRRRGLVSSMDARFRSRLENIISRVNTEGTVGFGRGTLNNPPTSPPAPHYSRRARVDDEDDAYDSFFPSVPRGVSPPLDHDRASERVLVGHSALFDDSDPFDSDPFDNLRETLRRRRGQTTGTSRPDANNSRARGRPRPQPHHQPQQQQQQQQREHPDWVREQLLPSREEMSPWAWTTSELQQLEGLGQVRAVLESEFRDHLEEVIASRIYNQLSRRGGNGGGRSGRTGRRAQSDDQPGSHQQSNRNRRERHQPRDEHRDSSAIQTQTNWRLQRQVTTLTNEVTELRRLMSSMIEMQMEMQRSIRQEVSAALNMSEQEVSQMQQHISRPEQANACVVCCEYSSDTVLYKCGHMCLCSECATVLIRDGHKCPICRAPVEDAVRAFKV